MTDRWLFAGILAVMVPARVLQTLHVRTMSVDGGYYTDVAKHVRDGEGLVSALSLYNFGYERFPYPTSVYPLWPLLYGGAARLVDLEVVAHWLPFALSLLAVVSAYGFGARLAPAPLHPRLPLHAGHVFALALATHAPFVECSSLPYTEPLAWLLLFGFLWRLAARGGDASVRWGLEIGLWLAALYFSRYQLVLVAIAFACTATLRLALGPDRRRLALHALAGLAVPAVAIGAWFLYLRGFVHDADAGSLLRFDQNRANALLPALDVMIANRDAAHFVLDRLRGVVTAWNPRAEASYQSAFHTLHWALPLAAPVLAVAAGRFVAREGVPGVVARLRAPEAAPWLFLAVLAFGGLLSVHLAHKVYAGPWYFAKRAGLPSLFAFALPLAWLLPRGWAGRLVGLPILASTAALGAWGWWWEATTTRGELRMDGQHDELVAWLQERADREGRLVVAMDAHLVQRVGWRTDRVGYHWVAGKARYDDLLTMTDRLGARYLVVRPVALTADGVFPNARCRLDADFVRLAARPDGMVVFERGPRPPVPPRKCK